MRSDQTIKWIFFDVGSTLVDEMEAYDHRVRDVITGTDITFEGKIFLPFVDDDPKTAEIISKVLLFAEDDKIKDPMILSNISK